MNTYMCFMFWFWSVTPITPGQPSVELRAGQVHFTWKNNYEEYQPTLFASESLMYKLLIEGSGITKVVREVRPQWEYTSRTNNEVLQCI